MPRFFNFVLNEKLPKYVLDSFIDIGPKPNLEWQITKVVYKNVALVTSVWWFEGKANNTALYNYSSNFYSRFISEAAK